MLAKNKGCVILVKNNNIKIIQIKEIPGGSFCEKSTSLDQSEIELLKDYGVKEVRYWYYQGNSEGNGQMLTLKDKKWYYNTMSHCSCYGPLDKISFNVGYSTLSELMGKCSDELKKQLKPLVEI